MMDDEYLLYGILFKKEESLLDTTVRNDPLKIAELLSAGFVEFGSSGKQYDYTVGNTFGNVKDQTWIEEGSQKMMLLTDRLFLLLYIAIREGDGGVRIRSNRSSVWKRFGEDWKMIFHQGSNIES